MILTITVINTDISTLFLISPCTIYSPVYRETAESFFFWNGEVYQRSWTVDKTFVCHDMTIASTICIQMNFLREKLSLIL